MLLAWVPQAQAGMCDFIRPPSWTVWQTRGSVHPPSGTTVTAPPSLATKSPLSTQTYPGLAARRQDKWRRLPADQLQASSALCHPDKCKPLKWVQCCEQLTWLRVDYAWESGLYCDWVWNGGAVGGQRGIKPGPPSPRLLPYSCSLL